MVAKVRGLVYRADYSDGDVDGPWRTVDESTTDMVFVAGDTALGLTGITPEGSIVVRKVNKTGGTSVKGTVVEPSGTTESSTWTAPGTCRATWEPR